MQGRTAVFHTLGDVSSPTELRNVAANVFTAPEIASVGWTEKDVQAGLVNGTVHKIELELNPRAKVQGINDGFIKLIASSGGTVIGGVVVAPKASELIYPIAIAVENRLTVDQVARTFAVYPSISTSITDAARDGDPVALAAFNTTGQWLGAGIASLSVLLDPACVVIGGGVIDAGEILLKPTREALERTMPFAGKHPYPELIAAQLGNEAGLVGVADLARA